MQQVSTGSSSDVKDSRNEYDKGAFDAVTRATANHGLASEAVSSVVQLLKIQMETNMSSHTGMQTDKAVMSDGSVYTRSTNEDKKAVFTAEDGSSFIAG